MKKFLKVLATLTAMGFAIFAVVSVFAYNNRPLPFEETTKTQGDPVRDFIDEKTSGIELPDFSNLFGDSEPTEEEIAAVPLDMTALRIAEPSYFDYDRDAYGASWTDVDFNGCDTRNDILARDLVEVVKEGNCKVTSGVLNDKYTGETIEFIRGKSRVDIDHIIPLSYAHKQGAGMWSADTREAFANDPANLSASSASANRSKGDAGPSEWMPSNTEFQCDYGQQFASVAIKYDLPITQADYNAIVSACAAG